MAVVPPPGVADSDPRVNPSIAGSAKIRTMAAAAANLLTAMASPPTLALSASISPAGSTKTIAWNNGAYRDSGPVINNGSNQAIIQAALQSDGVTRASGWGQGWLREFGFDGQYLSIRLSQSATRFLRIWVDGVPHSATLVAQSSLIGYTGSGGIYLNIDFGSRAWRQIAVELEDSTSVVPYGSMTIDPRDTVTPPLAAGSLWMWVGDSYGQGTGATRYAYGFVYQMARMLGMPRFWQWTSQASTGLVKTSSPYGAYLTRIADVIAQNPAGVVIQGSINDAGQAGIGAALTTYISTLKAALPRCRVIVTSPLFVASPLASYTTVGTDMSTAAAALGVPYLDLLTPAYFSGTGKQGSTTGDGNADYYRATDGTHPNDAGHYALARTIAPLLGAQMGAVA